MGFGKLTQVVDKLNESGLRTQRGYPAKLMPELGTTVAAVNIASITPQETRVAVRILSPTSGSTCEAGAKTAATALSELGAVYQVGECGYDSQMGLFTCCVTGIWKTTSNCTVQVNGVNVKNTVAVSVKRSVARTLVTDPETGTTAEECRDQGWNITIEEILPANTLPEVDLTDAFTVAIYRPGGYEQYKNCKWVQISLQSVANGLRRLRIARTWEDRIVQE